MLWSRRRCLAALSSIAAAAAAWPGVPAHAHTPYGQWAVYRQKHLLIGCHRADPRSYELAQQVVSVLSDHLPAASARVARAPDARRLASLLGTDQLQVAVLDAATARAMAAGNDGFEPYGAQALSGLAHFEDRCIVVRSDMPEHHAWQVAQALDASWTDACGATGVSLHPGVAAWQAGRPLPAAPL